MIQVLFPGEALKIQGWVAVEMWMDVSNFIETHLASITAAK